MSLGNKIAGGLRTTANKATTPCPVLIFLFNFLIPYSLENYLPLIYVKENNKINVETASPGAWKTLGGWTCKFSLSNILLMGQHYSNTLHSKYHEENFAPMTEKNGIACDDVYIRPCYYCYY